MSEQTDKLTIQLEQFGLSEEEAKIFLLLIEKGYTTALQLSRKLHIARTKVYRLLDKLYEKGLVNRKHDDVGFKFGANSHKRLEMLILEKEAEIERLKKTAPSIFSELTTLERKSKGESKVLYYSGIEGLKQVTWNSIQAKGELCTMELSNMSGFLDQTFAEKVREEMVSRKINIRQLSNLPHMDSYTKVKGVVDYWECRYLDPKLLTIEFEMLIYNNVYAIYNYQNNDIFCVEIYNQELSDMQKQLFDYIWKTAKPMKVLSPEGEASV